MIYLARSPHLAQYTHTLIMIRTMLRRGFATAANDFLSTQRLRMFGSGDYPQALDYSRPFQLSKTNNGITVASEIMESKIASISVFIKCGSRNQTEETSGVAHFLEHLHFKGTQNRTREGLQLQVENMGANLNAYTSRQNTSYMMTSFKQDLPRALAILGDMLTNSLYRPQDVQNQRSTIHRQLIQTRKSMPLQTTIEISHRGIFQGQQIGLPILGDIRNMQTISRDMIKGYHDTNYVGDNMYLVASGDIDHKELVAAVQNSFRVPKSRGKPAVFQKPRFCPGMSTLRADNISHTNMVVVHEAPSFFQHDFFAYLLLQRIVSDRPEFPFEQQIMKNSNCFKYQKAMANHDYIQTQKGFFSSYWDTGLYGNYFRCQPDFVKDILKHNAQAYAEYANRITDEELQRGKRKVYNEVLHHQTQNDITQSIANNLMYYERRVHTKQLAERVACVTAKDLNKIAEKVYKNMDSTHVTLWGSLPAMAMQN